MFTSHLQIHNSIDQCCEEQDHAASQRHRTPVWGQSWPVLHHPPLSLALAHRVTCHYAVKKRPRKYLDATELSGEGSTVFTDLLLLYPSHKSSCQQIFQAPV